MQPQKCNEINTKDHDPDNRALSRERQAGTGSERLIQRFLSRLSRRLPVRHIMKLAEDGEESPYLLRYAISRGKRLGIYLHNFVDHDQDREMHDHPWYALSVVLCGSYTERRLNADLAPIERKVRLLNWLRPDRFHMITEAEPGTWTLMIRFRRIKGRGFLGDVIDGQASYRPISADIDADYRPAPGKKVI